jgi:hypothetical protein
MEKQTTTTTVATKPVTESHPTYHILYLGKKKKKAIKDLKNGCGKLMFKIEQAIEGIPDDKNRHVIVVICKKKGRRKGGSSFPCSPLSPLSFLR